MLRHFGLAMVFCAGVVFGCGISSFSGTSVAQNSDQDVKASLDDVVDQLKELNKCVKSTDDLLHSNSLRVVTVINPGLTGRP